MRRISTLAIMLMALPVYAQPTFGFMELLNATDVPEEFSQPVAVAVDANGNVYVAAFASNNAFKITPDDTVTEIINGVGAGMGSTLNGPIDIAVDSVGNVYIAGNLSNNVFMITPDLVVTEIMNKDSNGPNTLLGTVSIAVDSSLNVYVAGDASNNAFKIEPDATITEIIDNTGDGTSNLVTPHGIAVGPNGNVYVSGFGTGSRNAFEITPGGAISEIIDGTGAGGGKILGGADGVAVDSAGNVYVVGNLTDNVFRITPSGAITEIIKGSAAFFPKDVAVDLSGNVYVTGFGTNNAFRIDTPDGCGTVPEDTQCTVTEIIDLTGDAMGNQLVAPIGIAVDDDGSVFIAGSSSDNVFVPEPGHAYIHLISVLTLVGLRKMRR